MMNKSVVLALSIICTALTAQAKETRSCSYSYAGSVTSSYDPSGTHSQHIVTTYSDRQVSGSGSVSGSAVTANNARRKARDNLLASFGSTAAKIGQQNYRSPRAGTVYDSTSYRYNINLTITGNTGCAANKTYSATVRVN